jgi:hypothetical protein
MHGMGIELTNEVESNSSVIVGRECRGMEMGLTNEVEPNSSVDGSAKIREKHLNSS